MMAKNIKSKLPLIIFSILVISAILLFWQKSSPPKQAPTNPPFSPAPTPPTPPGWKVYKNDQYRFSIAISPETNVIDSTENHPLAIDGFTITHFLIPIWVYKTNCDQTCFQQEIIDWWPKTKLDGQPITINGIQGYQINFDANADGNGPVRREIYLRSPQNTVIFFVFPYLPSTDEPLHYNHQHILDSFTFY